MAEIALVTAEAMAPLPPLAVDLAWGEAGAWFRGSLRLRLHVELLRDAATRASSTEMRLIKYLTPSKVEMAECRRVMLSMCRPS